MTESGRREQASAGSLTPTANSIHDFLRNFLTELNAYSREIRIYPSGHPHLLGRTESLVHCVTSYMSGRSSPLHLQVREGTVFSDNVSLGAERKVPLRLAHMLRERMVQLIILAPEIGAEEALALAKFIAEPMGSRPSHSREVVLGRHARVYRFPGRFRKSEELLTQEQVIAQAQRADSLRNVPEGSDERIKHIRANMAAVLEDEGVQENINAFVTVTGDRQAVVSQLFTVLEKAALVDWTDVEELRDAVNEGLRFLQQALFAQKDEYLSPLQLLSENSQCDRALGRQVRWQLLRTFLGDKAIPPPPRREVDLAVIHSRETDASAAQEPPASGTHPAEEDLDVSVDSLRRQVNDYLNGNDYLLEFTEAVNEIALGLGEPTATLRDDYARVLRDFLRQKKMTPAQVAKFLRHTARLDAAERAQWQASILHELAFPCDVLPALCPLGETQQLEVLKEPPLPLDQPLRAGATEVDFAREVLRLLIARGDDYALNLTYLLLTSPPSILPNSARWIGIVEESAALHPEPDRWVEQRARFLCQPGSSTFLGSFPYTQLRDGLARFLRLANESEQLLLIQHLRELDSRVASRLLTTGLSVESPRVRSEVLGALGSQQRPGGVEALCDALRHYKELRLSADEIEQICTLLAVFHGDRGLKFLAQVLNERQGLLFRWPREIRRRARDSLAAWYSEEDLE